MPSQKIVMRSLKRGMLVAFALPVIVAIISSTALLWVEIQQLTNAYQTAQSRELIKGMSALIHEQQKERGATSVFLNSGGREFRKELDAQRRVTDLVAAVFVNAAKEFGATGGEDLQAQLDRLQAILSERGGIRTAVDSLDIAPLKALGHYTAHNAAMLDTMAAIGSLSRNPDLTQMITSLGALLTAKEYAGIERAIGSGGFALGAFDLNRIRTLERLVSLQNDHLRRFALHADETFRAEVAAIDDLKEVEELKTMRALAFAFPETGSLNDVGAADFFAATTARINALKTAEDRLVEAVADTAGTIARKSLMLTILLGAGLLAAAMISACVTSFVIRKMLREVKRISDAADGMARGDDGAALPKRTLDELMPIVNSITYFQTSVAEAREREAAQRLAAQEAEQAERAEEQRRQKLERQQAEQEAAEARQEQQRLKDYADKVSYVVSACARGDFTQNIDLAGQDGVFLEIGEALNTLVGTVEQGLSAAGTTLARVSKGDLTAAMEGSYSGAFAALQRDMNRMIKALRGLVGNIKGSTTNLALSSKELRDTSDDLSRKAEQNAASLEETSAALEQLSANISQVNNNVEEANKNARVARETAEESGGVASDAAEAMNRISEASKEIANVVTAINDISFQINLLALNAGVEAARAGDAGRGFSVVASEVRQLAQRAGEAATEIEAVIVRSDLAVSEGVTKVQNAQRSFEKISDSVIGVSDRIEHVSRAVNEQVAGINEIANAVAEIDNISQKQAASFEEVTAASNVLSAEADGLARSTAQFDIGTEDASPDHTAPSQTSRAAQSSARMPGSFGQFERRSA